MSAADEQDARTIRAICEKVGLHVDSIDGDRGTYCLTFFGGDTAVLQHSARALRQSGFRVTAAFALDQYPERFLVQR